MSNDTLKALQETAETYFKEKRFAEALAALREYLHIISEEPPVNPVIKGRILSNMGIIQVESGKHRAVRGLPLLGESVYELILALARENNPQQNLERIKNICTLLVSEFKCQNLTDAPGNFLIDHARSVFSRISDRRLRESISIIS